MMPGSGGKGNVIVSETYRKRGLCREDGDVGRMGHFMAVDAMWGPLGAPQTRWGG